MDHFLSTVVVRKLASKVFPPEYIAPYESLCINCCPPSTNETFYLKVLYLLMMNGGPICVQYNGVQ